MSKKERIDKLEKLLFDARCIIDLSGPKKDHWLPDMYKKRQTKWLKKASKLLDENTTNV